MRPAQEIDLVVNGENKKVNVTPEMPLLWVLRDELQLTGTKYGCGVAACGACTVHIDGIATRSCQVPVGAVDGEVVTIEGLSNSDTAVREEAIGSLHAVQEAWAEHQVAQCGYCQAGQIMQAAYLLDMNDSPSDEDIDNAMSGNLCRCGTYPRIRAAIHAAATKVREA